MKKLIYANSQYLFLGIIFVTFSILTIKLNFISDDAFISFRYAKNFISGNGLVYNIGERVEGYTNFLWVMICSLILKFNDNIFYLIRFVSLAIAFFIFFLLWKIGKNYYGCGNYSFISVSLLAVNAGFVAWAYSGLETPLFTLLVLLCFYVTLRNTINERIPELIILSVLLVLLCLTRPEGLLISFISFSFLFFKSYKNNNRNFFAVLKIFYLPLIIFIVLYLIYFLWRYNYYGYFFPNTYYAKTGGGIHQYLRGITYLVKFIKENLAVGLLLFFPIVYVFTKKNYKDSKAQLLISYVSVFTLYIIYVGGDGLGVYRFFLPILPLIFLMMQLGIMLILENLRISKNLKFLFVVFVILTNLMMTLDSKRYPGIEITTSRTMLTNLMKASQWLKNNSKKNESVALNVAGIIPYYSELYTIDRFGLNDVHIAHKKMDNMGKGLAGHEKNDDEYIFKEKKPDYFIISWPSHKPEHLPDMIKDSIIYNYKSILIGEGEFIDKETNSVFTAPLYFNFYQKIKE